MKLLCLWLLYPALSLAQTPDTTQAHHAYLRADSLEHAYYHDSAFALFQRAVGDYYRAGAWERYVNCLNHQSYCQNMVGRYKASLALAKYALQFSIDSLGKYHAETAEAYANVGVGYQSENLYDSALHYHEKALAIREEIFGEKHAEVASSLIDMEQAFYGKANYDLASTYQKRALQILLKTVSYQHKYVSRVYTDIGNIFCDQSKYDSALFYYRKALQIDRSIYGKDHPALLTNACNIVLIQMNQHKDDCEIALQTLRKFSTIYKGISESHNELIWLYLCMGGIYQLRSNFDLAISFYHKALTLCQSNKSTDYMISYLYHCLGVIYNELGAHDLSLEYLNKCLAIEKNKYGKEHPLLASTYSRISYIFSDMGKMDLAKKYAYQSLQINQKIYGNFHPDVAISYNSLGTIYALLKDYDKAIEYQKEAITANKGGRNNAFFYQDIGEVYKSQKKFQLALRNYRKAIAIYRNVTKKDVALSEFCNGIAALFAKEYSYDSALCYYQQSILHNIPSFNDTSKHAIFSLDNSLHTPHLLTALHGKATTFEARYQQQHRPRDLQAALQHYQLCDTLIAAMQHQYLNHSDRVTFGKTAKQVYEGALRVSLKMAQDSPFGPSASSSSQPQSVSFFPSENQKATAHYTQQAFYFAERAKAGALTLALADRRAKHFAGVPDSLLAQEKRLKQERTFYQTQRHEAQTEGDDRLRQHYEDRLFTLNRSYDSLVQALEQRYPRYHALKYTTTVQTPNGVQQQLDERTAFLEYVISDTVGYVFSLTRYQDTVHTFAVDSGLHRQLQTLAHAFAPDTVASPVDDTYAESAYQVYQRIVSGVLATLPPSVDRLIIVPDGSLSYLPFDMLPTEPVRHRDYRRWPYLLRKYAVSYAYSATLQWPEGASPANPPPATYPAMFSGIFAHKPTLLALAPSYKGIRRDTVAQRALGTWRDAVVPLAWNQHEVDRLRRYLPGTFIAGDEAQEATFKQQTPYHEVLHLAAHALLDEADPMQSRLVFSAATDSAEDGFLHAYELYGMDIPARLAVLSACHTGNGQLAEGEGLLSLARTFAYAGCPSVIMNRWAAHDATTPWIMDRLYYYLAEGYAKADALRHAKLDFLAQANAHTQLPTYWGGWMLVGNSEPLYRPRFKPWAIEGNGKWIVVGLLLLMVGIGGWWWKVIRRRIGRVANRAEGSR